MTKYLDNSLPPPPPPPQDEEPVVYGSGVSSRIVWLIAAAYLGIAAAYLIWPIH